MPHKVVIYIFLLLLSFLGSLNAQTLRPVGHLLQDSIKIGEPFPYALTLRYPRNMDIVFPDSTYQFGNFELLRKEVFSTRSDSVNSFDSVVFYLQSFELDPQQAVRLPAFLLEDGDSSAVYTQRDTVFMIQQIATLSDTTNIRTETSFFDLENEINYVYILLGLLLLIAIAIAVYVFFGDNIKRKIQLYRMKQQHKAFMANFTKLIERSDNAEQREKTLVRWKQYMESLERKPYSRLTTKEILRMESTHSIADALHDIDRSIYGRHDDHEQLKGQFFILEAHADNQFKHQVAKLEND